ncbi:uncharacterized protein LOC131327525 [Rhododendron vialii]|uniref:uncharacterized protein LOC131327525 n=1 Tax=Rhododendron vialii TaxID=182163 RepID=UPI00265EF753|nr:uncharacterized protein LOC131327525 [Rhododendron vialii]
MNGWVKINFDGGLDSQMKLSGIGIIIRDSCGRFRAARAIHFGHLMEPVIIEAMAARESLIFAQELGMQKVHIEGDSQQVVDMIQRIGDFITSVGVLIVNLNRLKQEFVEMQASFVRRGDNSVAHAVAKNVVRGSRVCSWNPDFSIYFVRMRAPYDVFDFHCFLVLIKSLLNCGPKKKVVLFLLPCIEI